MTGTPSLQKAISAMRAQEAMLDLIVSGAITDILAIRFSLEIFASPVIATEMEIFTCQIGVIIEPVVV